MEYFATMPHKVLFDAMYEAARKTGFKVEFCREEKGCYVIFKEYNEEKCEFDLFEKLAYYNSMGYRIYNTKNDEEITAIPEADWLAIVTERFGKYGIEFKIGGEDNGND